MALYLKYRPQDLENIQGNVDLVSTLSNMLADPKKCPHTIMLAGPTGCGKTTIARIIAERLGCKGTDFREINSADFRGIDSAREIIQQTNFKPLEGSCRVWLIDECHKLTSDAQNAFLKRFEDTPSHVYFILCTTEPNKVIAAVKGRCSIFNVTPLSDNQMMMVLRRVVKGEGESLPKEVYLQIIQDSLGHVRNAIQTLEQVLSTPEEKRLEVAKRAAAEQSQSIELCRALIGKKNWKQIAPILAGIKDQDPEGVRRQVMGYCQAILLKDDNIQAWI